MNYREIASGPLLAAFLLTLTLSIVWAASIPIEDPFSALNTQWDGTSTLVDRGFLVLNDDPTKTISSTNVAAVLLIVGPDRLFSQFEANNIKDFVSRGGFLVLADNSGTGNSLLDLMGLPARFDGRLVVDSLFYRWNPQFPVISDFSQSELSTGLGELVLNHATVLNVTAGSSVKLLAYSSPFSFFDSNQDGKRNPQEPSGPFPVLAELQLGKGAVFLLSSPGSFANGLIDEADNRILVDNIVRRASPPGHRAVLLLDETHLETSSFTRAKLVSGRIVTWILAGGMPLSGKLGFTALVMMVVAARYAFRRPSTETVEEIERSRTVASVDVKSVLRLHPAWDPGRLGYVASELQASMRWRRLREGT